MKNILIFGPSRAGKTSLAKRLKDEFHFNVVNVDHLVNTFEEAFPHLGISVEEDEVQVTAKFTPFIVHYIGELTSHAYHKTGSKFVVDMGFFDFDTGIPLMHERLQKHGGFKLLDEFMFIGLLNNKTSEELFSDVRKYDVRGDWTYNISDDELRRHCQKHCDERTGVDWGFYENWKALGFWIYDVTEGREQAFDRIVGDLKGTL
ncbi:MAG: EutP/PduV family microcompartment system protein [Defluviitaleaceae bacterium]|nr:EutP/PduV family microcompartment system protein [Defluviitaleaceae bacterium]